MQPPPKYFVTEDLHATFRTQYVGSTFIMYTPNFIFPHIRNKHPIVRKHVCISLHHASCKSYFNRLTPNDPYMGRTAPLTSKRCILCIYSTHIDTAHFKHALYSPFFFSSKCSLFHNANLFRSCIIHILYTGCAKIKKIIPAPKGLGENKQLSTTVP